jgi:hypothetical protein
MFNQVNAKSDTKKDGYEIDKTLVLFPAYPQFFDHLQYPN